MIINNATVAQKFLTEEVWASKNPTLLKGEIGFYTDSNENYYFKVGDGTTPWNELASIFADKASITKSITNIVEDAIVDYNGKNAIVINDKESGVASVELKLSDDEKVLTQDVNGLVTHLELHLDPTKGVLTLQGNNGIAISSVDFPVEQILKSSSFNNDTHILTLVFNTTKGDQTVTVDLTGLVDVYSAGNGLNLAADGTFSVKKSSNSESFLTVDSSGVAITGVNTAISDAVSTAISNTLAVNSTGNGNVVTSVAKSGSNITVTKGMTALQASDLNNLTLICGFAS